MPPKITSRISLSDANFLRFFRSTSSYGASATPFTSKYPLPLSVRCASQTSNIYNVWVEQWRPAVGRSLGDGRKISAIPVASEVDSNSSSPSRQKARAPEGARAFGQQLIIMIRFQMVSYGFAQKRNHSEGSETMLIRSSNRYLSRCVAQEIPLRSDCRQGHRI